MSIDTKLVLRAALEAAVDDEEWIEAALMNSPICPGCDQGKEPDDLCCDPCWKRIPTNLPGHDRWRSELRRCRRMGGWSWNTAARILDTARYWLQTHPSRAATG